MVELHRREPLSRVMAAESAVQTGKRQPCADGQVKVGGVIDGQPVTVGQAEHAVVGNGIGQTDRKSL